jgi:hypothetical protein
MHIILDNVLRLEVHYPYDSRDCVTVSRLMRVLRYSYDSDFRVDGAQTIDMTCCDVKQLCKASALFTLRMLWWMRNVDGRESVTRDCFHDRGLQCSCPTLKIPASS